MQLFPRSRVKYHFLAASNLNRDRNYARLRSAARESSEYRIKNIEIRHLYVSPYYSTRSLEITSKLQPIPSPAFNGRASRDAPRKSHPAKVWRNWGRRVNYGASWENHHRKYVTRTKEQSELTPVFKGQCDAVVTTRWPTMIVHILPILSNGAPSTLNSIISSSLRLPYFRPRSRSPASSPGISQDRQRDDR